MLSLRVWCLRGYLCDMRTARSRTAGEHRFDCQGLVLCLQNAVSRQNPGVSTGFMVLKGVRIEDCLALSGLGKPR